VVNKTSNLRAELILQRLLKSQASLENICSELIEQFTKQSLTKDDLEVISTFFLYCGQSASLVDFLTKFAIKGLQIPWAHYVEALFMSTPAIPESIKSAVLKGAELQGQLAELSRSRMLDHFDERLPQLRNERRSSFEKKLIERKEQMLAQAELLKGQGLFVEEGKLLERLIKIFPNDSEIHLLLEKREKRKQLGLLHEITPQKPTWIPLEKYEEKKPEILQLLTALESSMQETLGHENQDETLAQDFAVAQMMLENEEASLRLLSPLSQKLETQWLRFEAMLKGRLFLQLIDELVRAERSWVNHPDATYGILYFRAQAFWELGQKQSAMEIMESIAIARPDYRNAAGLLSIWKGAHP